MWIGEHFAWIVANLQTLANEFVESKRFGPRDLHRAVDRTPSELAVGPPKWNSRLALGREQEVVRIG